MAITASMVKELRERTGVGMMDCKKALTETNGDLEQAVDILRKKGMAKAAKKAGRVAAEGTVICAVKDGIGAIAEVNCETDFVSRGDRFIELSQDMLAHIMENKPENAEDSLLNQKHSSGKTVKELLDSSIAEIGENIKVRRFQIFETSNYVVEYTHMNGKIGVLLECEADDAIKNNDKFQELAKDISMHIAAMNPGYVRAEEIPESVIAKEREIYAEQVKASGKPDNIIEKIVDGKIKKFEKENCLLDQLFVKDEDNNPVSAAVDALAKELGGSISIKRFVRYQLGEGIEKVKEDFAAEVSKMMEA